MADFKETLKTASLAVLRRELTDEERAEFLDLGASLGMNNVEDYLYIIMVFKRHSDAMEKRFDEISALERRINDTLEYSIQRILGEGAARISADMAETVAVKSRELMSSVKEFHVYRGFIIATSIAGILATIAYWFGVSVASGMEESEGLFKGLLQLPAGWWMILSMISYAYFWFFDNRRRLKESLLHKCLLALLGVISFIILINML